MASTNGSDTAASSSSTSSSEPPPGPPQSLIAYITSDMIATTLFVMRMVTIIGSILFLVSVVGFFHSSFAISCYLQAMLTAFFTFTIRLYLRKKQREVNTFSREMLELFTSEDSGHYMIYCFFFYNQYPFSIYLLPVFLYAVLHTVTYTQKMIPFLPGSLQGLMHQLNTRIAGSQTQIKRFIAYTEIFLMPIVIWNVLTGYMFLLAPAVYYYFLKLRYMSRRNQSVRIVFSALHMEARQLTQHPRCPAIVATVISKAIMLISRLAPDQGPPSERS